MADSADIYKLITNDGKVLEISKQAADRSGMLVELLKNCPIDDVKSMDPIVLAEVNESIVKMITTKDGKVLEISKRAADRSGIRLLRNCPRDDVKNMDPIVLDRVKGTIVKMVIKWCEDHKDLPILTDDRSNTGPEASDEIKNKEMFLL